MAEAVVSIALQTLTDLLIKKGKSLFAVPDEVKALQTQLKEIKCFLKDADRKQHKSETVRNWIAEIRDLAYRSEDVVAEYSVRMSSSSSSSSDGWGRRLLHGCSGVRQSSSLLQLSSEMSDIKSELERIIKAMENEGINKIIDGAAGSSENQILARRSFPSFVIGDCFVGKEEELERLVSLVVDDKEHPVISVWGMGGLGKTTIAKMVYNQMKEAGNSRFDCFVWVCISQQCQIRTVLEDILKQMGGGSVSDLSEVQLIERLCEIQTNKRRLIVLDDLWEISHWNALKHAFPLHNLQSKILVTTRNQKVADIGCNYRKSNICQRLVKKMVSLARKSDIFQKLVKSKESSRALLYGDHEFSVQNTPLVHVRMHRPPSALRFIRIPCINPQPDDDCFFNQTHDTDEEGIDKRAEDFIAKFYQEIKLPSSCP